MKRTQVSRKLVVSGLMVSLAMMLGGCDGGSGGGSGSGGGGAHGSLRPDFVIDSVILDPPNPAIGQTFTASVVIKNIGNGTGNPSNLTVWLDQSNVPIGVAVGDASTTNLNTIGLGETTGHPFVLVAPSSGGPWNFRAFVNNLYTAPEIDNSNNQYSMSYGAPIDKPDFAIDSITVSDLNPRLGAPFTATVTVTNLGGAGGFVGYLDVWANQPSTQLCGAVGDRSVNLGWLSSGATVSHDFDMTAPPTAAKSWTFRAYVDSECETIEIDKSNNQFEGLYGGTLGTPYRLATTDQLSLFNGRYADYYRLTRTGTNNVSTTISMAASFDTVLILYDSTGTWLAYDDDSGNGLNATITYPLTSGTTYYIEATSFQVGVVGSYTLRITPANALVHVPRPW